MVKSVLPLHTSVVSFLLCALTYPFLPSIFSLVQSNLLLTSTHEITIFFDNFCCSMFYWNPPQVCWLVTSHFTSFHIMWLTSAIQIKEQSRKHTVTVAVLSIAYKAPQVSCLWATYYKLLEWLVTEPTNLWRISMSYAKINDEMFEICSISFTD